MSDDGRLSERVAALAERYAVEDAPPDGALPAGITPIHTGPRVTAERAAFIDLVFDADMRFARIEDRDGNEIRMGRWLDDGRRLRLPIPELVPLHKLGPPAVHAHAQRTERSAAYAMAPKVGTARARVLATFVADYRVGGNGLTHEEVATRTGLKHYTAAPRCTELVQGGWLEDSGATRINSAGNPAITWRLTAHAITHHQGELDAHPDR
jgi:hypothetical protein